MKGLDKIITEINDESRIECEAIIAEAKKTATDTVETAKNRVEEIRAEAEKRAEKENRFIVERATSDSKLRSNRKTLEFRQEVIKEIIAEAKKRLLNIESDAYFEVMSMLLKNIARSEAGKICISKRDKKRMSTEFEKCVKQHSLEVSDTLDDSDGGFVLVYGDTVENCSIDAMIDEKYEHITDIVNNILF